MGTKNQPGSFDCYAGLEEDEPFFVLKGTDPSAPLAVILWSELYRERKQRAGQWNDRAVAKYCEAHNVANAMTAWRMARRQRQSEPIPYAPAIGAAPPGAAVKLGRNSIYGRLSRDARIRYDHVSAYPDPEDFAGRVPGFPPHCGDAACVACNDRPLECENLKGSVG